MSDLAKSKNASSRIVSGHCGAQSASQGHIEPSHHPQLQKIAPPREGCRLSSRHSRKIKLALFGEKPTVFALSAVFLGAAD